MTLLELPEMKARYSYCYDKMNEARCHHEKGERAIALAILAALAQEADATASALAQQEDAIYLSFDNLMQMLLYTHRTQPKQWVLQMKLPIAEVHACYATLLASAGRYTEALDAMAKARRWNPMSCNAALDHADIHRAMGDLEGFRDLSIEALDLVLTPADLARCHRHLGDYAAAQKEWADALSFYLTSLYYVPDDPDVDRAIDRIDEATGDPDLEPTDPEALETRRHIPMRPPLDLIEIATDRLAALDEAAAPEMSLYFRSILAPWVAIWELHDQTADVGAPA